MLLMNMNSHHRKGGMKSETMPAAASGPAGVIEDDDSALMLRVGTGDQKAFAALMDRHLVRTVRLAARLLGSEAQADDVAQEAFVRVWRHAPTWQDSAERGARFTTWLYKIVSNLVIDEKRKRVNVAIDDIAEPLDDSAPNGEKVLIDSQRAVEVRNALGQLPDRQREAFVLCFYEEYSNRDAAQALDVSVKALESLLVRARRSLRDLLRPDLLTENLP